MAWFLARRLLAMIPIVLGVTFINYGLLNLAPASPVDALVDPGAGEAAREAKRKELGLDQPFHVRYGLWLRELVTGNLGYSYGDYQAVSRRIGERFGATTALVLVSTAASMALAVVLGTISALKRYSFWDYSTSLGGLIGVSVPGFFLGLGAIYVFSLKLRVLPTGGMLTTGKPFEWLDFAAHLVLPAATLGLFSLGSFVRYMRSGMLEVLGADFVRTARAKGLSDGRVLYVHALRNALIPLITVVAITVPRLLGGSIVVEQVFAWPGMGRLAIQAILQRDYPVLMGVNLIVAFLVLAGSLAADLLYAAVDPRIRYG
jgi:peptide/nickel transport system permease protein